MSELFNALSVEAAKHPTSVALRDDTRSLSWSEMLDSVEVMARSLSEFSGLTVGLLADNTIDWILVDLACLYSDITLIPIPVFFSESQRMHSLDESGAVALISPSDPSGCDERLTDTLCIIRLNHQRSAAIPESTAKVTFTSGSTGKPKGVCLSERNQLTVARSILERTALRQTRHLCVLPLATLLENVAGVYAPLLSGGEVIVLPMRQLGLSGSSEFDVQALVTAIDKTQPQSLILLPALLTALIVQVQRGWTPPASLQFIAVGGSRVGRGLLDAAEAVGIPVYEGYGLSECSSVVSLNTRSEISTGTAGKPLSHSQIHLDDGEVVVSGNSFLGYVNDPESWYREHVRTGDLGFIDDHGYLHILGRKKNLLISSFGRNINPEWVESEVMANPAIAQCVVLGDARPFLVALISPRHADVTDTTISAWLKQVNQTLPDYARIKDWLRLSEPLCASSGTMTANGKPVRDRIEHLYNTRLDTLYKERA